MPPDTTVLFICTGNIFRSMTAEYALKKAIGPESGIHVHSAGLSKAPHGIVPFVRDYHLQKGIDISSHQPRKIKKEMLSSADLSVAMDFDHRNKIEEIYSIKIPLFSEVATGKETALLDVFEVVPDWLDNQAAAREYGWSVMDTIFNGMREFVNRMPLYIDKRA